MKTPEEFRDFTCSQCGAEYNESEHEYTPWMCGCGNDLTSNGSRIYEDSEEDVEDYLNDEDYFFSPNYDDSKHPDYLPNLNFGEKDLGKFLG